MHKPVRKVRSNGKTVVGQISSKKGIKVQFESSLEEGFVYMLNFDPEVTQILDQPMTIPYTDSSGKSRSYTPDYLVKYRNGRKVLFEIKHSLHVNDKKKFGTAFKAAAQLAKSRGWHFKKVTEKNIKNQYGDNVRFLHRYQEFQVVDEIKNVVITSLKNEGSLRIEQLKEKCSMTENEWLQAISTIWSLIYQKVICCELSSPLTMSTTIYLPRKRKINYKTYPY